MQKVILITAAFKAEIAPLLLPRSSRREVVLDYLITGMGMDNVRHMLEKRGKQAEFLAIVNVGTAGAIAPELSPLMVFFPSAFCRIENRQPSWIKRPGGLFTDRTIWPVSWKSGTLFTSRTAVSSSDERLAIREHCQADAVDMEAFAVAEFCERRAIPFACLKVITDLADTNSRDEFKKNLGQAVRLLADNASILIENLWRNFESGERDG